MDGLKDVLGLWINDTEGKLNWMQIFDEIKVRGVEYVAFISMDGVSGLEEGAKAIFPQVVVQRCIVHLIRNSIKYIFHLRITKNILPSLRRSMVPSTSRQLLPNLADSRKLENITQEPWAYGSEIGCMWNSFFTMAVLYAA